MNEKYLIKYLKEINKINTFIDLKENDTIRALMNITMPVNLSDEFYILQDAYLKDLLSKKEIFDVNNIDEQVSLYLGDITLIKADVIVNACNSELLGCFHPLHKCIDNAIHSYAGLQVRRDCLNIINKQGYNEKNGNCKVTSAYNLPSKYIFHTVGPIIQGKVTKENEEDLKNCYLNCLKKSDEMKLSSIVFCSISTGVYSYPIDQASKVAIDTVRNYLNKSKSKIKVIFNLFSRKDFDIYEARLSKN